MLSPNRSANDFRRAKPAFPADPAMAGQSSDTWEGMNVEIACSDRCMDHYRLEWALDSIRGVLTADVSWNRWGRGCSRRARSAAGAPDSRDHRHDTGDV